MIGIDVYAAALTVFFGYDAATALYEKKKHSTMGRLEDPKAHAQAVAGICRKWAVKTPVLRIRKPCRYLLIDRIRGRYGKTMVQSWQRAGCILGLLDAGGRENEDAAERAMSACLKENGTWSFPVNRIDYAMLAYAVLRAERNPARIKPAMDAMLNCLNDNLCADGMLSYSVGKTGRKRFVDTLGLACPFLARYGRVYGKPEYMTLAVHELGTYRERGLVQGLPMHCYDAESGTQFANYLAPDPDYGGCYIISAYWNPTDDTSVNEWGYSTRNRILNEAVKLRAMAQSFTVAPGLERQYEAPAEESASQPTEPEVTVEPATAEKTPAVWHGVPVNSTLRPAARSSMTCGSTPSVRLCAYLLRRNRSMPSMVAARMWTGMKEPERAAP